MRACNRTGKEAYQTGGTTLTLKALIDKFTPAGTDPDRIAYLMQQFESREGVEREIGDRDTALKSIVALVGDWTLWLASWPGALIGADVNSDHGTEVERKAVLDVYLELEKLPRQTESAARSMAESAATMAAAVEQAASQPSITHHNGRYYGPSNADRASREVNGEKRRAIAERTG